MGGGEEGGLHLILMHYNQESLSNNISCVNCVTARSSTAQSPPLFFFFFFLLFGSGPNRLLLGRCLSVGRAVQ